MHSDFFIQVHEVAKLIPKGRVTSYGAIATYLGTKKASRTVGYAMNAAHGNKEIPAHRVVNRIGLLTGKNHFDYPDQMEELLKIEGILVFNNQIQDFTTIFWDPTIELS